MGQYRKNDLIKVERKYEKQGNMEEAEMRNQPVLLCGDCLEWLKKFPDNSIDCIITSPPYYRKREYLAGGIGMEKSWQEYVQAILAVTSELYRVLKPTGSLWLNLADSYYKKELLNLPHRIAIRMQDEQGWILRNTVIWDKVKGTLPQSKRALNGQYEPLFHFVKDRDLFYYDQDSVRKKRAKTRIKDGRVISASGVSGVRYRKKILDSTELSENQKENAIRELEDVLKKVEREEITDFRMVIKGAGQRVTNGDSPRLSGRAYELKHKGYYFLFYHPKGSMISDVWPVIPENTQNRKLHFAPFPEDLVKVPVLLTCPENGIVLDPFAGTGTVCLAARNLRRKAIGIDLCPEYLELARERIGDAVIQDMKDTEFLRKPEHER